MAASANILLLPQLLTVSAEKFPQNTAVRFQEESLSYQELDRFSNQVANQLLACGARHGDRVGIYLNKSIPSIISIFGILKAGAVYVPLDANAPISRIAYIIENCQISCLLTSSRKASQLPEISSQAPSLKHAIVTDDAPVDIESAALNLYTWDAVIGSAPATLPANHSRETDLAYILYTSGSTGVPKGVMISHLNALTFINWCFKTFSVTSQDCLSSHAPLHFDLSIHDIYVAIKAGATIALVSETLSLFPPRLAAWISSMGITVWYSVPSILSMLVLHGRLEKYDFSSLRTILFAGEVFPVKYLRALMEAIPGAEYYNLYGPTETNVITYFKTPPLLPDRTSPVPIGKACENMEVFALTKSGKLVSKPGEEGELIGRGPGVARGYWGDAEKTAANFIQHPLQRHSPETVYRTGDIVTIDEDGNYIYIGRKDQMIKSRGYRIEIGDIETAIYSHPAVQESAVVAIPDDLLGNRLKVFVVLKENVTPLNAAALRMHCAERLPKYMIPETVEFLPSLPKTSTGKTDKPALLKMSGEVK